MLTLVQIPGCCGVGVLHGLTGATSKALTTKANSANYSAVIATATTASMAKALEGAGFVLVGKSYNGGQYVAGGNNIGTYMLTKKPASSYASNVAVFAPAGAR